MRKRAERAFWRTHFTAQTHPALTALIDYAAQRPGLDIRNYGSWQSYCSEAASITRQWHTICELLRIADFYNVTDQQIIDASQSAYSGRYAWDGTEWLYCTGQYWPCEYRAAAIAVLRYALPADEGRHTR